MSYSKIACIFCSVEFPAGIAIGTSSSLNLTEVDRNGKGKLVLRGTAISGVMRHEYLARYGEDETNDLFGKALDAKNDDGWSSRIQFFDSILDTGAGPSVERRTHNAIDRHWGRVTKHSLFSLECCPPRTGTGLMIEIHGDKKNDLEACILKVIYIIREGLILGGNSNRGIGLMKVSDDFCSRVFELQDIDQHAEYLDFRQLWKQGAFRLPWDILPADSAYDTYSKLRVQVDFRIPDGQDILIADGSGTMEPQRVTATDGNEYWRLPGSSLRGVMRAYIENLASREGERVAYSLERMREYTENEDEIADKKGWLFDKPSEGGERKAELHEEYPVASLFGSLHAAGRIHISDAYVPMIDNNDQERIHVAVDTISGGAIEGMLFSNRVLTSRCCTDVTYFRTYITVSDPDEREVRWIVTALRAINTGYLRVGSSKAAGRLSIPDIPIAEGKLSNELIAIWRELSNG